MTARPPLSMRRPTIAAFAMDVQRYLADEPVLACPPSAWYRFRKFARRNKRGVLTASVVAVAVARLVAGTLLLQQEQARTAEAHASQAATDLAAAEAQARSRLETQLYLQRIALADREWSANNLSRMDALLEQCPSDMRGWEWHSPQAAAVPDFSRPCATTARSSAWRSAAMASSWPRALRRVLSRSGRRKPARNSGSGKLLTRRMPPASCLAATAGTSPREARI